MAKGKSVVMNNVCKKEGGRERNWEWERNGRGPGKLFTTFLHALSFFSFFFFLVVGLIL